MKEKPNIYISAPLPQSILNILETNFNCEVNHNQGNVNALIERYEIEFDGIISLLSDRIDEAFFKKFPSIKIVANYAVGFNNIDLKAASQNQVLVTNTPGVLTDTSADTAFALLMAVARRIIEADQHVRTGNWTGWKPTEYLGKDIWGSKLGIIGLGRIGKALAKRAAGFNMQLYYWNRTRLSMQKERELGLSYLPVDTLLQEVDFISLHLAYNADTHQIIDKRRLKLMKPTAFIINTARGAIIDEKALIEALQHGKIAGAGLDVFENEPTIPLELRQLKNVVLLPHLGSASLATREKMGQIVIENLSDFFAGKMPNNVVNIL